MDAIELAWKEAAGKNVVLEFIDIVVSGFAQIVFNAHPVTGVILIVAAFVASPIQAVSGLLAASVAAALVYLTGAPKGQAREGLYTINAALFGLAIPMVSNLLDYSKTPQILLLSVIGAVLCFFATGALRRVCSTWGVSPLAVPYSVTLAMIAAALVYTSALQSDPLFTPAVAVTAELTAVTWTVQDFVTAVLNGLGQIIWMEDVPLSALSGVIVLVGIACASRIDAIMALLACTLATALAAALGISQSGIMLGLYGYNAALLAMVCFGRAFKMSPRSFAIILVLSALTVFLCVGLKPLMAIMGAPVAALPFSLEAIMLMLGSKFYPQLEYSEPKDWTTPERSLS